MKKILIIFGLIIGFALNASAQIQYYRTTGFAEKHKTDYGVWTNWTDWQDSNLTITIDLNNDVITVYSPELQKYKVLSTATPPVDNSGKQVKFNCYDLVDNIRCTVRLRIENNGNSQIYIDWANLSIVYNVVRTA